MFSKSTQKQFWLFKKEDLDKLRVETNQNRWDSFKQAANGNQEILDELQLSFFTPQEEQEICKLVKETGLRFSKKFQPPMWSTVVWTAFSYFDRMYLRNSVMKYCDLRNVMISCFYLACKIEEFNVSIDEFVRNLQSGDMDSNSEMILSWEPILMKNLDFQLVVHTPYRPLEGHLLGMGLFRDQNIRKTVYKLFEKILLSDVPLLYPPTQISLACLQIVVDQGTFDGYLEKICSRSEEQNRSKLCQNLSDIQQLIDSVQTPIPPGDAERLQKRRHKWNSAQSHFTAQLRTTQVTETDGTAPGEDSDLDD